MSNSVSVDISKAFELTDEDRAQLDRLSATLGGVLTAWSGVELALCNCFATAVNPDAPDVAGACFWAVVSFEGKLKLADVAVKSAFSQLNFQIQDARINYSGNPRLSKQWDSLSNRLKSSNKIRNNLAHGSIRYGKPIDVIRNTIGKLECRVESASNRAMFEMIDAHQIRDKLPSYGQNDLNGVARQFRELADNLHKFERIIFEEKRTGSPALAVEKL